MKKILYVHALQESILQVHGNITVQQLPIHTRSARHDPVPASPGSLWHRPRQASLLTAGPDAAALASSNVTPGPPTPASTASSKKRTAAVSP